MRCAFPRTSPDQSVIKCWASIYDGQQLVGWVAEDASGRWHAVDSNKRLIGIFATRREAVLACPAVQS
jgi:hypothetical protein